MGCVNEIAHDRFPPQGAALGERVRVVFHYDTAHVLDGTVVRDDMAPPFRTIIRLDDGRHVLGTECQFSLPRCVAGKAAAPGGGR
jgi:hypothetical protein